MTRDGELDRRGVMSDGAGRDWSPINDLNFQGDVLLDCRDVGSVEEGFVDEAIGSSRVEHGKGVKGFVVELECDRKAKVFLGCRGSCQ